jgi:hypothetical protein
MLFSLFISQLNTHPEIWKKLQLLNVNDQGLLNVNDQGLRVDESQLVAGVPTHRLIETNLDYWSTSR